MNFFKNFLRSLLGPAAIFAASCVVMYALIHFALGPYFIDAIHSMPLMGPMLADITSSMIDVICISIALLIATVYTLLKFIRALISKKQEA